MKKPTGNNVSFGVINFTNFSFGKHNGKQTVYPHGKKHYETTDRLGNVRVTYTDKKSWQQNKFALNISSSLDYYPFGSLMEGRTLEISNYRFGFQGQEGDDEVYGKNNLWAYKYRLHDARLGRFFSVDPLADKYPYNSVYAFSENRVIDAIEFEGLESFQVGGGTVYGPYANEESAKSAALSGQATIYLPEVEVSAPLSTSQNSSNSSQSLFSKAFVAVKQRVGESFFAGYEFAKFATGLLSRTSTYRSGAVVEALKTSPGVQKGIEEMMRKIKMGKYDPQKEYRFRYSFTPAQIKWDAFKESIEAHSDVISTMSPAKLYVGSYRGTLKLLDDKTIQVTIENRTTLNSLFYHIGSGLEKLRITTEEKFNHLLEPFFTPTEQRFIFTVPLNQKK